MSGFLTVYNHYEDDELSAKKQITKILEKCYPLHLLTFFLAIPFTMKDLFKPNIGTWIGSFLNIILVQSWIPKSSVYFSNNSVSWYLSTYLFLMLISPFVIKWLKRLNSKYIIGLLVLNLSIQIALVLFSGNYSWAHWVIYIFPITRALDFISGGGIALLLMRVNISKRMYCMFLFFGITVSIMVLSITTQIAVNSLFLVAIWSLPVYAIIVGLFGLKNNNIIISLFQNRFVLYLGRISLELFLIHQLVIRYVETFARKLCLMSPNVYIIAFLVSLIGATVLHAYKFRRIPKE